jgi:hypothetical protein
VVCIDDEYAKPVLVEEVLPLLAGLSFQVRAEILDELPDSSGFTYGDFSSLRDEMAGIWDEVEDGIKRDILAQLLIRADEGIPEADTEPDDKKIDTIAAAVLRSLLRQQDFLPLSPTQWMKKKEELLAETTNVKTLFLFDYDLSRDKVATDGFVLLQEVLRSEYSETAFCGLLSHTFPTTEEYQRRNELLNESDQDEFVTISKERLLNDPISFARQVKLTILNRPSKQMIAKAMSVIEEAYQEARQELEEINIYQFEHIVFESSRREGVWEADTLFRLFGLFQQKAARKKAKGDEELFELASMMRKVSRIPTGSPEAPPRDSWRIQRLEFYEEGDYINSSRYPISLGDIFEKTSGGKKKYLLLAQPCDLMVRYELSPRGERHHAVNEVILAEIMLQKRVVDKMGQVRNPAAYYELPYFDEQTGESCFVSLRNTHAVKLFVLDLVVYRDDGCSYLKISDPCPRGVIPAWELRYDRLVKEVRKQINRYKKLKARQLPKLVLQTAVPASSNDKLFKGSINPNEESISYQVRRSGRLCQPRAVAALIKWASYMTRAAYEHDFGLE